MREFSGEYMRYCNGHNRRPDFKEQALVSILRILDDIRLKDFKRRHADQFSEERLGEGVRPATVNRGLAVIKNMLTLAMEREYLEIHPLGTGCYIDALWRGYALVSSRNSGRFQRYGFRVGCRILVRDGTPYCFFTFKLEV
jgi:hypothetical protein